MLEFNRQICNVTAKMLYRLQAILEVTYEETAKNTNYTQYITLQTQLHVPTMQNTTLKK